MKLRMAGRLVAWGGCVALGALGMALVGGGTGVPEARAQEPTGAVTGPGCILKGSSPIAKGTQLFDKEAGGRAIANFSGSFVPMQMSELPADASAGRAKLSTSNGGAALRLDGFVAPSSIPTYTARDVSVIGGHVWISTAQRVKIVRGAPGTLTVELTVAGSQSQTVRATAPCDAFALQKGTATGMEVPGSARGYLMKTSTIDLYDGANGDAVFSLRMIEGSGQLFWSTEAKAGFVHVQARGDLTIDAWARWRDLEALKKGEMMDQLIPPSSALTGAQRTLAKPPPLVKATKALPVRARRAEKEKPIGVVEAGAEVYLLETVAGWTNVLPKGLGMTPPDDGGFWIPAGEAPK